MTDNFLNNRLDPSAIETIMADCLEIFIGNMPDKGKDEFFRNHYFYRFFICALVMVAEQDGIPVIVDDPLEGNRSPLHVTANVLQERLDIGSATFRGIHVEAFGILCVGLLQQGLGLLLLFRCQRPSQ